MSEKKIVETFVPLREVLQPWFGRFRDDLPYDVEVRIRRDRLHLWHLWDELSPEGRCGQAELSDYENDPALAETRTADWEWSCVDGDYWSTVPQLTAEEFCILRQAHDPRKYDVERDFTPGGEGKTLAERVSDDVRILHRMPNHSETKPLAEWVAVARSLGWSLPAFMRFAFEPLELAPLSESAAKVDRYASERGKSIINIDRGENGIAVFSFGGKVTSVKDSMGVRYIEILSRHPGKPIRTMDLYWTGNPPTPDHALSEEAKAAVVQTHDRAEDDVGALTLSDTIQGTDWVLDEKGIKCLRDEIDRLEELKESASLEEREEHHAEIEKIRRYISANTRQDGRPRIINQDVERVRKSVAVAIDRAIVRITTSDQILGAHLRDCIMHGSSVCCYRPAAMEGKS